MISGTRNSLVFIVALAIWSFFYVPNPWVHFLDYHQIASALSGPVYYGVIPLLVAVIVGIGLRGQIWLRLWIGLAIPMLGVIGCLLFWGLGALSDEELLGAWLMSLPPIIPFSIGFVGSLWIQTRSASKSPQQ